MEEHCALVKTAPLHALSASPKPLPLRWATFLDRMGEARAWKWQSPRWWRALAALALDARQGWRADKEGAEYPKCADHGHSHSRSGSELGFL